VALDLRQLPLLVNSGGSPSYRFAVPFWNVPSPWLLSVFREWQNWRSLLANYIHNVSFTINYVKITNISILGGSSSGSIYAVREVILYKTVSTILLKSYILITSTPRTRSEGKMLFTSYSDMEL